MNNTIKISTIVAPLLLSSPFSAFQMQITTDTDYQSDADISGNKIVWRDNRNGDVYMYDLTCLSNNTYRCIT